MVADGGTLGPGTPTAMNHGLPCPRRALNTERGVKYAACLKTASGERCRADIRKSGVGRVAVFRCVCAGIYSAE